MMPGKNSRVGHIKGGHRHGLAVCTAPSNIGHRKDLRVWTGLRSFFSSSSRFFSTTIKKGTHHKKKLNSIVGRLSTKSFPKNENKKKMIDFGNLPVLGNSSAGKYGHTSMRSQRYLRPFPKTDACCKLPQTKYSSSNTRAYGRNADRAGMYVFGK